MNDARVRDIGFLEASVSALSAVTGIDPKAWEKFIKHLQKLKQHHLDTYLHCLRVGIYSHGLAVYEKWEDLKYPLFGGCGHDDGKCEIAQFLLSTKKKLTSKEFADIKRHVEEGFGRLKGEFLFTSFIAGLHHKYQEEGYGIDLEKDSPIPINEPVRIKIINTAVLVMIADFFDALTTRKNSKGLIENPDDPGEQFKVMKNFFPDNLLRVRWLVENRIK